MGGSHDPCHAFISCFAPPRIAIWPGSHARHDRRLAPVSRAYAQDEVKDEDIFRFALNLEYMEAEYYLRGTTGKGIDDSDAGPKAGDAAPSDPVDRAAPFELKAELAKEINRPLKVLDDDPYIVDPFERQCVQHPRFRLDRQRHLPVWFSAGYVQIRKPHRKQAHPLADGKHLFEEHAGDGREFSFAPNGADAVRLRVIC